MAKTENNRKEEKKKKEEPGLIPVILDAVSGQSFAGVHDLKSLAKRIPGNLLRGVGAVAEGIPLVGPYAGGGWRGLGDLVDYKMGNEAPAGNPNYDPNRRSDEGLIGSEVSAIPAALGFGAGKVPTLIRTLAHKGTRTTPKLTERAGLGGFIIGRPGKLSPRSTRVTKGGKTYTADADAAARSIDAKPIPEENRLPPPKYYRTHIAGKRPTDYRGTIGDKNPADVALARDRHYAVIPDGTIEQTRNPKFDDVLDFTGESLEGSNSRDVVEGIPMGRKSASNNVKPTDADFAIIEKKPAYKYSRVQTSKRIPSGRTKRAEDARGEWKAWERRNFPEAARDFELENWAANAPIGGLQGAVYNNAIPLGISGLATKGFSSTPVSKIVTSWARGVKEPEVGERVAADPNQPLEKRLRAAGFESDPEKRRPRQYSRPIARPAARPAATPISKFQTLREQYLRGK